MGKTGLNVALMPWLQTVDRWRRCAGLGVFFGSALDEPWILSSHASNMATIPQTDVWRTDAKEPFSQVEKWRMGNYLCHR